jgi:uncharacterized protein (DUF1697 family)
MDGATSVTIFLALLRAVNLGGATQVSMSELRDRLTREGYGNVRSILQSGNLIFESPERDPAAVEKALDARIAPDLGARTEFFVRSAAEWSEIVRRNPFPHEAVADPGHLLVTVLKAPPTAAAWRDLAGAIPGRERVHGVGRTGYFVYPDGVGRSKVTARFIEARLGTQGTSRNWNTVRKLDALASE